MPKETVSRDFVGAFQAQSSMKKKLTCPSEPLPLSHAWIMSKCWHHTEINVITACIWMLYDLTSTSKKRDTNTSNVIPGYLVHQLPRESVVVGSLVKHLDIWASLCSAAFRTWELLKLESSCPTGQVVVIISAESSCMYWCLMLIACVIQPFKKSY